MIKALAVAAAAASIVSAAACSAAAGGSSSPVAAAGAVTEPPQQIPVICFHDIGTPSPAVGSTDYHSVTLPNFKAEMSLLSREGYHTVTPTQYANWLAGTAQALPPKPVLLTFDDLFTADLTEATPVLREYGFQATGFVVTGYADGAYLNIDNGTNTPHDGPNAYALWSSIEAYAETGTWTFQFHAGLCGHAYMPYAPASCLAGLDLADASAGAFQYYLWNYGQDQARYESRVTAETSAGLADMESRLPGFGPVLFASPFGSWGNGDNPFLIRYWDSKFGVIFTQFIASSDEPTAHADRVRFRLELGYGSQSASYLSGHLVSAAFTRAGSNGTVGA